MGVEAIHGNLEVALFSVLMSICPEATFYDPKRVGGAVDVLTKVLFKLIVDSIYRVGLVESHRHNEVQ